MKSLVAAITRLTDQVNAFPKFREATVKSLSPVSVRFDTDSFNVRVQGSLTGDLAVDSRVMTMQLRNYIWILGKTERVDTGWKDVSYESGFTAGPPGQLQYRRIGNRLYLRGGVTGTIPTATYTLVATLPSEATPDTNYRLPATGSVGRVGLFEVLTDGRIQVCHSWDSPPSWMGVQQTILLD